MSMQTEKLVAIRVKLNRALSHIREVNDHVGAFLQGNPFIVGVKTERQQTIYYLEAMTEPPAELSAITGEVLFNLRSALDHLAYSLAEMNHSSKAILRRTCFPISDKLADYRPHAQSKLSGLGQKAAAAINALEPYNGGKGTLLWRLHRLNNIDKHRMLITVGCQLSGFRLHTTRRRQMHKAIHAEAGITLTDAEAEALNPYLNPDRKTVLKKGTVLVRDLFGNEEESQTEKFAFDIALNEPSIIDCEPLVPALVEIAEHVDKVTKDLEPFFV